MWVNLKTGAPDAGASLEIYRKDKLDLSAIFGRRSFGAGIGLEIEKKGNLTVSVMAGAAHPYSTNLFKDWAPVAGLTFRF